MPDLDVVDQTWIGLSPDRVGAALAEASAWPRWWPDLQLRLARERGAQGLDWTVVSARGGRLAGTMEVWLEAVAEGAVAHYFLRLNAVGGALRSADAQRLGYAYRIAAKRALWSIDATRLARLHAPAER